MPNRLLTSHAGSLPRPENLIRLNERRATAADAAATDEHAYQEALRAAVTDVVERQRDTGIDLVNDGEYGHSMGQRYDYGSWWTYVFQRLGGLELAEFDIAQIAQAKARPGEITLARSFLWGKSFGFKVAMNAARACRLCDRCHARRHSCNPRVSILTAFGLASQTCLTEPPRIAALVHIA